MKTKLTFLLLLFALLIVNSQSQKNKENLFDAKLDSIVDNYEGYNNNTNYVVQDKLLNERIEKAFNQVVFGSSNLVDNASAFGVSLNDEETRVSVSTNFHLMDCGRDQLYLKTGMNAGGSGSLFNLYSANEWQNSIGGNVGFIFKFYGTGITNEDKNKLEYDKTLRKIFITDSIKNKLFDLKKSDYKALREAYISAINNSNENQIKEHFDSLKKIEAFYKQLENSNSKKRSVELDFNDYTDETINKQNDSIIDSMIDRLWKNKNYGNKMISDVIKEVAYIYDMRNVKNTGYSFCWFDINLRLNNDIFNFSEKAENVNNEVLEIFNGLKQDKTGINKLKTAVSTNINYSRNTKNKGAWFGQLGHTFNSGSFLNSNLINGTATVSEFASDLFLITDEDKNLLGDFNSIDKNLQYGSIDFYGAHFFGKKKVFGLNLALSHRYAIKTPQNSFYKNNYSVFFGPVFRKPKDDRSTGLTFSLDFGLENTMYDSDEVGENFVGRIRVGIPFRLFAIE